LAGKIVIGEKSRRVKFGRQVVMKVRLDENIGFWAGIITVVIIGKCWIVPWMSIWEILWVAVKSQIGILSPLWR